MPNYVKLNFLSDDIAFLYVNCIFVIGREHPKLSFFFSHVQLRNTRFKDKQITEGSKSSSAYSD